MRTLLAERAAATYRWRVELTRRATGLEGRVTFEVESAPEAEAQSVGRMINEIVTSTAALRRSSLGPPG